MANSIMITFENIFPSYTVSHSSRSVTDISATRLQACAVNNFINRRLFVVVNTIFETLYLVATSPSSVTLGSSDPISASRNYHDCLILLDCEPKGRAI